MQSNYHSSVTLKIIISTLISTYRCAAVCLLILKFLYLANTIYMCLYLLLTSKVIHEFPNQIFNFGSLKAMVENNLIPKRPKTRVSIWRVETFMLKIGMEAAWMTLPPSGT